MNATTPAKSPLIQRMNTLFAEHADDFAVIDRDLTLTFARLDAAANALARELLRRRLSVVGLYMTRSAASVVAAVAAAKAGIAYVPMGLDWPDARCRRIASRCGLAAVLVAGADAARCALWAEDLPLLDPADFLACLDAPEPDCSPSPDTVLYIMHTSGSTGEPKGVRVHHEGIHSIFSAVSHLGYAPGQRMVHAASMTFDMSIMELWGGLLNGCTLCISDPETLLDARTLEHFLVSHGTGLLLLPTSVFNAVTSQDPAVFRSLRHLCFGGEMPGRAAIAAVLQACPTLSLHNCYGPTECSVFVAAATLTPDSLADRHIPAGQAVGQTRFLIVDEHMMPLACGEEGELIICGPCVALGYVQEQEKNRAFLTLADGTRAYRSGDLACLHEDGTLYVLGRSDDQIKISGCRIEPGEVCAVLQQAEGVRMAHIGVLRGQQTQLAAYVVPASAPADTRALEAGLRIFLRSQLPDYMVPRHFFFLDDLPLSSSGKIDKTRLPGLQDVTPPVRQDPAGHDPVLHIFRTVLEKPSFGHADSFLEAGGSSIMAARLIAALREHSGIAVPFSLILEPRTATRASLYIENARLAQQQRADSSEPGTITARI